ncbi:aspartate/glutamate racemase family protein [Chloroflexota bacterium]
MKLIDIPPYRGVNYTPTEGHFLVREILDDMRKRGQLEGVEIDIDDGYPTEHRAVNRDEEVLANITVGFLKRVREISELGKYDAIVTSGSIEPGFFAGRMISKIPIAFCLHSAVHVASLIGDRFTIIELADPMAQIIRHYVQLYGLSHKLASVRTLSDSSTVTMGYVQKYKKEERVKVPEVKKLIDDIVVQCTAAIEKDMADSLILGCPPLQCLEGDIRKKLDEAGYDEIQLISELPAAVEVAKAMVNMKLTQAPRAYPSDFLKVKPQFR